ncbi:DUF1007 domain-containing protein [Vibrio neptunius]
MNTLEHILKQWLNQIKPTTDVHTTVRGLSLAHWVCFQLPWCRQCWLLIAMMMTASVQAHPHSWINLKTDIQGQNGMITGLKMEWTFDAMTSAYLLDGKDMSAENQQASLQAVSASVLDNMLYEHYFTYFYDGETPIKYKTAHNGTLRRERAKLVLSFELPLATPHPITSDSLRLLIFEPSYYVGMTWPSSNDVTLSADLAQHCHLELIEPNPTSEQMSYAMSLSADADPDNALGQLFTQTVKIHCASLPSVE